MKTFIEKAEQKFILQMMTFNSNIGSMAVGLGLDPAKLVRSVDDHAYLKWVFDMEELFFNHYHGWIEYKKLAWKGQGGTVLGAPPSLPLFPLPPTNMPPVVTLDARAHFQDIIQDCVKGGLTQSQGETLGIVEPVTAFDPETGKPVIKYKGTVGGGYPDFGWLKDKFKGVESQLDLGTGFTTVEKDTTPDWTDKKTPLPAPGTSQVRKYRFIYFYGDDDHRVGAWSDTIIITVYGE